MGRSDSKGAKASQKGVIATLIRFYLASRVLYKKYSRYVRLRLTRAEAETLLDALESWIEGSRNEAFSADDDIIGGLFSSMSDAVEIRRKLWKKM